MVIFHPFPSKHVDFPSFFVNVDQLFWYLNMDKRSLHPYLNCGLDHSNGPLQVDGASNVARHRQHISSLRLENHRKTHKNMVFFFDFHGIYPLVMTDRHSEMENHIFLMRKFTINIYKSPFSIITNIANWKMTMLSVGNLTINHHAINRRVIKARIKFH